MGRIAARAMLAGMIMMTGVMRFNAQGQSQVSKVGTTIAQFLKIDVTPRATALGGSFVAVANDAEALYWNPAGISRE